MNTKIGGMLTLLSFLPRVDKSVPQRPTNVDRLRAFRNARANEEMVVGNGYRWPIAWRRT